MSNYNIIRHSKGPWKDHKYKRIENGQYIYNDSSSSSASKPISKSEINSNEKRNESFTGNALYKTGKMGGPLKGVPYAQAAGGFYLYNNPNIRNGRGKYLVYKPDGSKLYINSLDEWKDLRNNKTAGSSSSSDSSKKKKKATPTEQIEELKEDIGEIKDLELDLSDVAGYDALANRELERLEAEQRAKEEALKKKQDAKRMAENMKKQKEALRRKKQFENQNKVINIMETARHSDIKGAVIIHSKGPWKDHRYIRKENGKYIYKDENGGFHVDRKQLTNDFKTSKKTYEIAKIKASKTTGGKVGDTTRSVKNAGGKTNTKGYAYDFSGKNDKSKQPQKIDNRKNNAHSTKEQSIISKLSDANYRDTIDGVQYYKNPDSKEQTVIYTDKKGRRKTKTVTPNAFIGVTKDGRIVYVDKLPKKSLTDKLGFDERKALKEATNDAARAKELNQKTLAKGGDAKASTIYAINKQNQKEQAQKEYDRTDLAKAGKKVNETVENVGKAVSDSADKAKKLIKKAFRHSDMYGIDYGYAIVHSAKGDTWKKHKYIRKEGNKYIYKEPNEFSSPTSGVIPVKSTVEYLRKYPTKVPKTKGDYSFDPFEGMRMETMRRNYPDNYNKRFMPKLSNKGRDVLDTNRGKASDLERAQYVSKITTGSKVGDTTRSLKNNSAGYAYDYSGDKDKSIKPQKIDDRSWKSLGVNSDIVEKLSDKNYVDTIDGIQYYLNPEKGETVYDEINKTFTLSPKYIGVREDGKTVFTSKLPKKKLTDKLGFDEKERLKKASRDQHASQRELTKSLQKNHKEDTPIMGTIWAIDSLEDKKKAKAEYDATPLGKAENKVNEVKSDIKNTAKKATSTVKSTGKKVGSILSNVVTRKTTLDASKDSSNSKVKGILDDVTKKKKVKHSSEGTYLAHSYRVIRK